MPRMKARIVACTMQLGLSGCSSLKEKRGVLKTLIARLQREFNVAIAETEFNDVWQSAALTLVAVANDAQPAQATLQQAVQWVERHRPDIEVQDARFEIR